MQRDGVLTSLWQYKMPDYISQSHSIPNETYDVLIVGGGITGITTALLLQQAGKKCLIAEAHTIGYSPGKKRSGKDKPHPSRQINKIEDCALHPSLLLYKLLEGFEPCGSYFCITIAGNYLCNMELIYNLNEIKDAAKKFLSFTSGKKIFSFHGNLGAGKTTFIKAVCTELGVEDIVSSPTYSIIHQYKTANKKTIYHLDLYRLKDKEEAIQAGVEECLYSGEYCFIEWPEKLFSVMPVDTVQVFMEIVNETKRKVVCKLP